MAREILDRRSWQGLLAAFTLMALTTRCAFANGPAVGFDGAAVFPIQETQIRLVSEDVDLDFTKEGPASNATCVYHFRNLSTRRRVFSMAFITPGAGDSTMVRSRVDHYRTMGFEVAQDGIDRPVRFMASKGRKFQAMYGVPQDSFPVWDLTVEPKADSRVTIRYRVEPAGGCDGLTCGQRMSYIARPAAFWAGRLDSATIRFHIGSSGIGERLARSGVPWTARFEPMTGRWTSDGVEWRFLNWKPDCDPQVVLDHPESDGWNDPAWSPFTADSDAALPQVSVGLDSVAVRVSGGRECPRDRIDAISGAVHFRVNVNDQGTVDEIRALDPPTGENGVGILAVVASCVLRWHFRPAIRAGRPVDSWLDVTVTDH